MLDMLRQRRRRRPIRSAIGRRPSAVGRRRQAGFTLIEAALTTVIIGTGVLAIVAAQQAYHKKNDWAQRTGTAVLLANELRELTLTLPMHDPLTGDATLGPEASENGIADFDDLDDFAGTVTSGVGTGTTFDPPVNALRQQIPNMAGWSQEMQVVNVLPDNISTTITQPLGTTDLMRVTVTVRYQSPQAATPLTITQLSWLVTK